MLPSNQEFSATTIVKTANEVLGGLMSICREQLLLVPTWMNRFRATDRAHCTFLVLLCYRLTAVHGGAVLHAPAAITHRACRLRRHLFIGNGSTTCEAGYVPVSARQTGRRVSASSSRSLECSRAVSSQQGSRTP